MKKNENSEIIDTNSSDKTEKEDRKKNPIFAIQQNNFYLPKHELKELRHLAEKHPNLAEKYLNIIEEQSKHVVDMDKKILALEEKEQDARLGEIPFQRKYAFRGQMLSFLTVVLSFCTSGFFAYLGHEYIAGMAIAIPIGVLAVNFIGFKNKGQS